MQATSGAFKEAIKQPSRELKSRVTFPGLILDDIQIQEIEISSEVIGDDEFEIGTAQMASAQIIFIEDQPLVYDFSGKECTIELGIVLPNLSTEYVSMGRFTVESSMKKDTVRTIKCVDRMHKTEKQYQSGLVYPQTVLQVLQDACNQAGITLATTSFNNSAYSIGIEPVFEGITCRKIIEAAAELAGGYAVIDRSGNLMIKMLSNTVQRSLTQDHYITLTIDEVASARIDKVVVKVGEESAEQGTGVHPYTVVDNLLCQNPSLVAGGVYAGLNGIAYSPLKLLWQGDFSLDVGDYVTVNDGKSTFGMYLLTRKLTYKGGLREESSSPSKSDIIKNSTGKNNVVLDINRLKTQISIESGRITQTISELGNVATEISDYTAVVNDALGSLQNQIDGSITTWFYGVPPSVVNQPASNWVTTDDKNKHLGDLYYDTVTGYAYRWQVTNNNYSWQRITDTDVTKALEDASKAQDTADSKRRVFVAQPTTPYEVGDLWTQGASGDIMRCQTTRLTGSYSASDWIKASKYTDDTAAIAAATAASNAQTSANTANSLLADIADDNKLTPSEKQSTKLEWDIIAGEKPGIDAQATTFGITTEKTAYTNAYNTLSTYITPLLADINSTSSIIGTTFRTNFKVYYDARVALLNKIALVAKQTADAKAPAIILAATAPGSPVNGQMWLDTSLTPAMMKVWNGSAWKFTNYTTSEFKQEVDSLSLAVAKSEVSKVKVGGRNLVIRSGELINSIIATNGEIQTFAGCALMNDYISVTPGETLTFSKVIGTLGDGYWRYSWNNADKVLISRTANNTNLFQWTVPAGAYFLRVSYPIDALPMIERGNIATDWTPAPEDVDQAITTAQTAATNALAALADISADNKVVATEKQILKIEWDTIVAEKTVNDAQATTFGITTEKTNYNTKYTALNTYINTTYPLFTDLTATTTIDSGATLRSRFNEYYDTRTALLNAIAAKAKTLADAAQTTANGKNKIFTTQPAPPYQIGDIWQSTAADGVVKVCVVTRATGSYTASDWSNDGVSQRMQSAEQKITPAAIVSTFTTQFGADANAQITKGIVTMTKDGINVAQSTSEINTQLKNTGLEIKDGTEAIAIFGEAGAVIPKVESNLLNTIDNTGSYNVGSGQTFSTITQALNSLFKGNNRIHTGGDITLIVKSNIVEDVLISGLQGTGRLIIQFDGVLMQGRFRVRGNQLPVYFINGVGASRGRMRRPPDGIHELFLIEGSNYVQINGMDLDGYYGNYVVDLTHGGNVHIQNVDVINTGYLVRANNACSATIVQSKGNVNSGVADLSEGAKAYLSGTAPAGGVVSSNNNGFVIINGTLTRTASTFSPPAQTSQILKQVFTPSEIFTCYHDTTNKSPYYGSTAAQSRYDASTGHYDGVLKFGSELYNFFNGGTAIAVRIRLRRKNSTHGTSAAVLPTTYKANGSLWSGVNFGAGAVRGGWSGWATVPSSLFLSSGAELHFWNSYGGSQYAIWDAAEVEVTVTKTI